MTMSLPVDSVPNVSVLLNLVPDQPAAVLQSLEQHPALASQQDENGYSLVHASASYAQLDLLQQLVQKYGVNVNISDEDSETPLFYAETVEVARCLVEKLGADSSKLNDDQQTAADKIEADDDYPEVALYLKSRPQAVQNESVEPSAASETQTNGVHHPPPPLPPNVQINMGTMEEPPQGESEADPEFRRRIEELASRDDFQSDDGQAQLRELITDAVRGVASDTDSRGGARRRVG